jgi:hypothetical protein
MRDDEIIGRIQALVEEEHELRSTDSVDAERLAHLEESLDQCWDLLRQRRARKEFGDTPDAASVREVGIVEGYQQ